MMCDCGFCIIHIMLSSADLEWRQCLADPMKWKLLDEGKKYSPQVDRAPTGMLDVR